MWPCGPTDLQPNPITVSTALPHCLRDPRAEIQHRSSGFTAELLFSEFYWGTLGNLVLDSLSVWRWIQGKCSVHLEGKAYHSYMVCLRRASHFMVTTEFFQQIEWHFYEEITRTKFTLHFKVNKPYFKRSWKMKLKSCFAKKIKMHVKNLQKAHGENLSIDLKNCTTWIYFKFHFFYTVLKIILLYRKWRFLHL